MSLIERRRLVRFALLTIIAILASRLWFIVYRAIDLDEFEHAHATWCVSRGLVPYADFFEHHTPWLYGLFAPAFPHFATDTDPAAIASLFTDLRLAMWAMTAAIIALVCGLGALWRDRFTGVLAAVLIATASQFLDSMLDFRPDVPGLLCFVLSLALATRAWRSTRPDSAGAWFILSGLAFGAALMFTQKYVFALPGFAAALLAYIAYGTTVRSLPWRTLGAVLFVLGALAPIGFTAWWFLAHHALDAFVRANVDVNVRLNAARFSPVPGLLKNALHTPALYVLGAAGFVAAVREHRARLQDGGLVPILTAASLFAGLVVMGRAYDQYFVMFFPHLAVFGAAWGSDAVQRLAPPVRARAALRAVLVLAPLASLAALITFTDAPGSSQGASMIAAFTLAAVLAALSAWQWLNGRTTRAACVGVAALAALATGNLARTFDPIGPQLVDIAYVTQHTQPTDALLGAAAGPGVFRPHATYYFFNSGPFTSEAEQADLVDALATGRMRPKIVMLDPLPYPLPPGVWAYVRAHYRHVRRTMYERIED